MDLTRDKIWIRLTPRLAATIVGNCLLGTLLLHSQESKPTLPSKATGDWELKSIFHTNDVMGIDRAEISSLIHSKITLTPQIILSCGQKLAVRSVQLNLISDEKLFVDMRIHFKDIHVTSNSLEEVVLNGEENGRCLGAYGLPGEHIYIKSRKELIVEFEGVFFLATRR